MSMKDIFEANTDKVDLAVELLGELGDRTGKYVWKKLTAQGGEFLDYVTADDENSYPNGALGDDGYWYEILNTSRGYGIFIDSMDSDGRATEVTIIGNENPFFKLYTGTSHNGYLFEKCEKVTIDKPVIRNSEFAQLFTLFVGKLKLKNVVTIESNAFVNIWGSNTKKPIEESKIKRAVFIPKSCETMEQPFSAISGSDKLLGTIYCEVNSKPTGWDDYFNRSYYGGSSSYQQFYHTVVWGVTEEQFDAL